MAARMASPGRERRTAAVALRRMRPDVKPGPEPELYLMMDRRRRRHLQTRP